MIYVMFEVYPKAEFINEYLEIAAKLKPMLERYDGLIRSERFESLNEEGKLLSLSVWEDGLSINKWRNDMVHRQAQKSGFDKLFEKYTITVLTPTRQYSDLQRNQAPEDAVVATEKSRT